MFTTLALLAALAMPTQESASARDAFLEGWFQETAEGDLEAALKGYRACVERGGAGDEALVAKAKLRMARIAGARGDREAERALLAEVVERYAGTPAGKAAAEALEAGEVADAGAGTADAAVAEARAFLDEMLGDEQRINHEMVKHVLQTLPAEEILARHALKGGSIWGIVKRVDDPTLTPALVAIATRADEDLAERALHSIRRIRPNSAVPEPLIRRAEEATHRLAWQIAELLASAGQKDELLHVLEKNSALSENPEDGRSTMWEMTRDGDAKAADIVGLIVGWMRAKDLNLGDRLSAGAIGAQTEVGERLRSLFPSWSAKHRVDIATRAWNDATRVGATRALLDLFLADSEPQIRWFAYRLLMESDDPERRREGFALFVAQPRPLDVGPMYSLVNDRDYPYWRDAIAFVPAGALRECIYTGLFASGHRAPAELVAVGLERGDPEVISALFHPTWWTDVSLRRGGQAPSRPWGQPLDSGGLLFTRVQGLRDSFAAHPDQELGRRLAEAALRRPEEGIRLGLAGLVVMAKEDRAFRGTRDLIASDTASTVRYFAVSSFALQEFSVETRAALLLDPDEKVRNQALGNCRDSDALIIAAESADTEQLAGFAQRAIDARLGDAVAALYPRLPTDHRLAADALVFLGEQDVEVVLRALDRGDPLPSRVSSAAQSILLRLPLPDELAEELRQERREPAEVQALAAQLRSRRDTVVAAFRAEKVDEVRRLALGSQGGWERALGRRLAELRGVDLALELVRSPSWHASGVGGFALAALSETEALRSAFEAVTYPKVLIAPALEAGLEPEVRAAIESGRLSARDVIEVARSERRFDVLADIVVGPPGAPRRYHDEDQSHRMRSIRDAVDHLAREGDVDRLAATVFLYDDESAVRALFQLEAYDRILRDLPDWNEKPRWEAMRELKRRTGLPEPMADWPNLHADQQALIEAWRKNL